MSHQILHAKVSAKDGNDYTFYHNGIYDKYELFRAIKSGNIIETCDEFGDISPVLTCFVEQNIIRINVKKVDVKEKSISSAKQDMVNTDNKDSQIEDVITNCVNIFTDDFADTFINIISRSEEEAKTPPNSSINIDDTIE